jgi:hypothetical protein
MLIGGLEDFGSPEASAPALLRRMEMAASAGIEVVEITSHTSLLEDGTAIFDSLVLHAKERGLGVIPRLTVDSKRFSETVFVTTPAVDHYPIPDYTNATQLEHAVGLVKRLTSHFDQFENVVAYQVDWGFWGEDWIPWPLWKTHSGNMTFLSFLHSLSPEFRRFEESNFARWPTRGAQQGMMFHSSIFTNDDPRADALNVAAFHWYQKWREDMTINITQTLRAAAKSATARPILGFSYTHTSMNVMAYAYTGDGFLDGAYSDANPGVKAGLTVTPNDYIIHDAYFSGIHLLELDFDTPYFLLPNAEGAIASLYAKGTVPVIFYPLWSKGLADSDVTKLVSLIQKYRDYASEPRGQVLLVVGNVDVGIWDYYDPTAFAHLSSLMNRDPPGIIRTLELNGISFDIVDARVYSASLGQKYAAVVVHTPRDSLDGQLFGKLSETKSPVFVMHSSFMFSSPSLTEPTKTASAYFENSNPVGEGNSKIRVRIWGYPQGVDVAFRGALEALLKLVDYRPSWLSSTYSGQFDEVLATAPVEAGTVIARKGNIYFFGLDFSTQNSEHNRLIQEAFLHLLASHGVKIEGGMERIVSDRIILVRPWDNRTHGIETNRLSPLDYPFFNGTHLLIGTSTGTRLSDAKTPYIYSFPEDALCSEATTSSNGNSVLFKLRSKGGEFSMFVPFEIGSVLVNQQPTVYGHLDAQHIRIRIRESNLRSIDVTIMPRERPTTSTTGLGAETTNLQTQTETFSKELPNEVVWNQSQLPLAAVGVAVLGAAVLLLVPRRKRRPDQH